MAVKHGQLDYIQRGARRLGYRLWADAGIGELLGESVAEQAADQCWWYVVPADVTDQEAILEWKPMSYRGMVRRIEREMDGE